MEIIVQELSLDLWENLYKIFLYEFDLKYQEMVSEILVTWTSLTNKSV